MDRPGLLDILFISKLGIKRFKTFRADTVGEHCLCVVGDIGLDLFPVSFVISYFFTVDTDRQYAPESFDLRQGNAEFLDGFLIFNLGLFTCRYIEHYRQEVSDTLVLDELAREKPTEVITLS